MSTSARTLGDRSARMCGRTSVMGWAKEGGEGAVKSVGGVLGGRTGRASKRRDPGI